MHVLGGLGHGGTERFCLDVLRDTAMHRPDVTTHLLYLDGSRTELLADFQPLLGGRIVASPIASARRLRFLIWMVALLWRLRPDGIILYIFGMPHILIGAAGRFAFVRRIIVSAGNPPPGQEAPSERRKWRWIVMASRLLRVPICPASSYIRERLEGLGTPLPKDSEVIHYGCAVEEIHTQAAAARTERRPGDPTIIGLVARLDPIKDHETLLRGFHMMIERHPELDLRLWLVGDGPLRKTLGALAGKLVIEARIDFLGRRNDIPALLGGMDLFVFSTTEKEGFGIALIEALAAGLPVVASDVPACREVVADSGAGLLIAAGDAEALATAMDKVVVDTELRQELSRRAHAFAQEKYDISKAAAQYLAAVSRP